MKPVTSLSAGPPCGGLYLKPPSSGGLCEGVTTMPSASPIFLSAIEIQNGVRNRGSGRVVAVGSDPYVNFVGRQHLQRAREGGLGKRMRIDAEEERPVDSLLFAIRRKWPA